MPQINYIRGQYFQKSINHHLKGQCYQICMCATQLVTQPQRITLLLRTASGFKFFCSSIAAVCFKRMIHKKFLTIFECNCTPAGCSGGVSEQPGRKNIPPVHFTSMFLREFSGLAWMCWAGMVDHPQAAETFQL
jgi:hypothetical protein